MPFTVPKSNPFLAVGVFQVRVVVSQCHLAVESATLTEALPVVGVALGGERGNPSSSSVERRLVPIAALSSDCSPKGILIKRKPPRWLTCIPCTVGRRMMEDSRECAAVGWRTSRTATLPTRTRSREKRSVPSRGIPPCSPPPLCKHGKFIDRPRAIHPSCYHHPSSDLSRSTAQLPAQANCL